MSANASAGRSNLYQTVTDAIIHELENGVAPWIQPWAAGGLDAALPYNAITRRPYNGSNVVLLWISAAARRFSSHGWLTYRQARQCGAQVKKGEKGTLVTFARLTPRVTGEGDDADTRFFPILRAFHVFNVCQVAELTPRFHGTSAQRRSASDDNASDKRATAFLSRIGADVRHGGTKAFYSPAGDFIQLPIPGYSAAASNTRR
jgi:antirestriction protein ArdC